MVIKLLLIGSFHQKNESALRSYSVLQIDTISIDTVDNVAMENYDIVYSPLYPLKVQKWPKTKFIFGPHFSVFPEDHMMSDITYRNAVFIVPSVWVKELYKKFECCRNLNIKALPF